MLGRCYLLDLLVSLGAVSLVQSPPDAWSLTGKANYQPEWALQCFIINSSQSLLVTLLFLPKMLFSPNQLDVWERTVVSSPRIMVKS